MPIFDFLCLDCGETSELLIAGSGETPRCKTCGGHNLKKLFYDHSSLSKPTAPGREAAAENNRYKLGS